MDEVGPFTRYKWSWDITSTSKVITPATHVFLAISEGLCHSIYNDGLG